MKKLKAGIIGTGNIGCDLLAKIQKSNELECTLFMGRNLNSKGMEFANRLGVKITDKSIEALIDNPKLCDIVFDATTASAHYKHAEILKKLNKFTIDLTPSLLGKMCIPIVNGMECIKETNINMVTCGGQATIPIISAVNSMIPDIDYIETVTSISADSAGPGTRANIDEFTQTTKASILNFSKTKEAKAIIILNPASPPPLMHNTIYIKSKNIDIDKIEPVINQTVEKVQKYVPGYRLINKPCVNNNILIVMVEVEGSGDYLPKYSGNLDIFTSSAAAIAQMYAQEVFYAG